MISFKDKTNIEAKCKLGADICNKLQGFDAVVVGGIVRDLHFANIHETTLLGASGDIDIAVVGVEEFKNPFNTAYKIMKALEGLGFSDIVIQGFDTNFDYGNPNLAGVLQFNAGIAEVDILIFRAELKRITDVVDGFDCELNMFTLHQSTGNLLTSCSAPLELGKSVKYNLSDDCPPERNIKMRKMIESASEFLPPAEDANPVEEEDIPFPG